MRSLLISWVATVLALSTVLLLPNVSVTTPWLIPFSATAIWLLLIVLWPVFKLFLLPFNLATFGLIGSVVYFFLFWLCLWLVPGLMLNPVRVFGFYLGETAVLIALAAVLSVLQRFFRWLLERFFRSKRRR